MTIELPTGILAVGFGLLFPAWVTGEGLLPMVFLLPNHLAILGLLSCFPIALWFARQTHGADIKLKKSAISTVVKYSVTVNAITWTVFIALHWMTNIEFDLLLGLYFPVGLAVFSILLTPLTIGQIIYRTTRKRIDRSIACI